MCKSVVCGVVLLGALALPAGAQTISPAPAKAPAAPGVRRWVDVQAATLGARYRLVRRDAAGAMLGELQHQQAFKARLNVDRAAKVGIGVALSTGASGTSAWDNAGVGANSGTSNLTVRQLFVDARPAPVLGLQYGGIAVVRGESTEITTIDNDTALVGERLSLRLPAVRSEVTLTQGYLGDVSQPSFFDRAHRFDEVNYRQVLVARDLSPRVKASFAASSLDGARGYYEAVRVRLTGTRVVDTARIEAYQREADAAGYAVSFERAVGRVQIGGGWADIDRSFTPLGGDRYGRGQRVFTTVGAPLAYGLTLSGFVGQALDRDVRQRTRVDLVVSYDLLKALRAKKVL